MGNTAHLVFIFASLGLVIGGMLFVMGGIFSEPMIITTGNSTISATGNATYGLIQTVGESFANFMLPGLILVAALVIISAIYLFGRKR